MLVTDAVKFSAVFSAAAGNESHSDVTFYVWDLAYCEVWLPLVLSVMSFSLLHVCDA